MLEGSLQGSQLALDGDVSGLDIYGDSIRDLDFLLAYDIFHHKSIIRLIIIYLILIFLQRMNSIQFCLNQSLPQNRVNCFLTFPTISLGITFRTLKWTVLVMGLHSPMMAISPYFTLKAGEQWTGKFLCLFSYLLYFLT